MMKLLEFGIISWAIFAVAITIGIYATIYLQKTIKRGFAVGLVILLAVFWVASWVVGRIW